MRRRRGYDHNASYRIVPRTPPLDARELDSLEDAVEIEIVWGGEAVLHVAHLSPPRTFSVGEDGDFLIGEPSLGRRQLPLVVSCAGQICVVVPDGASGELASSDGERLSFEELAARRRSERHADARHFPLVRGASARLEYAGFTFSVRSVAAGRRVAAGNALDFSWEHSRWTAASLTAHLTLLALFWLAPPCPIVPYVGPTLRVSAVPPRSPRLDDVPLDEGRRERGPQGRLGKPAARRTRHHYAVAGPRNNRDPHLARSEAKQRAATAGIVGILQKAENAAPTSLFGRDQALGRDSSSAVGALMGDRAGSNFGFGGLLLSGRGRGGGGDGMGTIGLGTVGTIGHGRAGGRGSGYGSDRSDMHGRAARVPRVRGLVEESSEGLSKEVIRRTIGRHLAEVRHCYERELSARPELAGRVAVKFVIAPTGAVQTALISQSDLAERSVEQCIVQAVRRWSFPAPDNGRSVVVDFPFDLLPL